MKLHIAARGPAVLDRPQRRQTPSVGSRADDGGTPSSWLAVAAYLRWRRLPIAYLDAVAIGFPLGMAIGRIGDVINGEHHGPPSDLPWAVRNSHPEALTPDPTRAYHSGGLYEVVLAAFIFAIVWPLRHRFRRPTTALWTVVALYGVGRFVMFFARSDSDPLALGLDGAQWTSMGLVIVAVIGLLTAQRRRVPPPTELHSRGRQLTSRRRAVRR